MYIQQVFLVAWLLHGCDWNTEAIASIFRNSKELPVLRGQHVPFVSNVDDPIRDTSDPCTSMLQPSPQDNQIRGGASHRYCEAAVHMSTSWPQTSASLCSCYNYGGQVDCSTLLLARHLADAWCFIGLPMPSGIVQKKEEKKNHVMREFLGNPTSSYRLTNHTSV